MIVKDKNVLVFGSGISGEAACALLLKEEAKVVLYDGNDKLNPEEIRAKIEGGDSESLEIILGTLEGDRKGELLDKLSLVVMSPGVPTDLPIVNEMREKGLPIWVEIELAYAFGKGDVLAITGTNGKTTTTSLLGEIMKNYAQSSFVVGNIGNPYTSIALQTREDSVIVAEMSSFQLETIQTFCPRVSAILNITPDHLNRHHTMEAYIEAKENIAKNQTEKDTCVLNYEDDVTRAFGENVKSKVLYFSSQRILEEGIYLENGQIVLAMNGEKTPVCHVDELNILGTHNHENAMAAAGMAAAYGVPVDVIRRTLKEFQGVEHRIEYVDTVKGVAYYNDSKGTNPDAAIKGIKAMNRPTWLIGGGYDKKSTYDEWIEAFDGKVKELILMGVTAPKIADCAKTHGFDKIKFVDSMEEAVSYIAGKAQDGEAVLLSPACASWGMFPNYEVRGDIFKDCVRKLKEN